MKELKITDLEIIYDMEKNNYMMTHIVKEIDETTKKLGISRRNEIEKPLSKVSKISSFDLSFKLACTFGILFAMVCWLGSCSHYYHGGSFEELLFMPLLFLVLGGISGLIIGVIIGKFSTKMKENSQQNIFDEEFERKIDEYNKKVKEDDERVQVEKQQIEFLNQLRIEVSNQKQQALQILNNFYIEMGIDKEFRQLIAVGYMYEFMRLGIATKLEGADGLYYLIKKELRYDQIQATLDDISEKLDTIIDQNSAMYQELKNIDRKCGSIVRNTAQIAYNTAQIASNTENIGTKLNDLNQNLDEIQKNTEIGIYISQRMKKEQEYQNYFVRRKIS